MGEINSIKGKHFWAVIRKTLFILALTFVSQQFIGQADSLLMVARTAKIDSVKARNFGTAAMYLGYSNTDSALFYAQKAIGLTAAYPNTMARANTLYCLGNVWDMRGETDSALYYLSKARQGFISESNLYGQAKTLISTGIAHYYSGDLANALSSYVSADSVANIFGGLSLQSKILNNIAVCQRTLQRYEEALLTYGRALELKKQTKDIVGEAHVCNNLVIVLAKLERFDEALEYAERALGTYNSLGLIDDAMETKGALGEMLYHEGRLTEACAQLEEAHQYLLKNRKNSRSIISTARYLANCYKDQKEWDKLFNIAQKYIDDPRVKGNKITADDFNLMMAYATQNKGDFEQASIYFERSLMAAYVRADEQRVTLQEDLAERYFSEQQRTKLELQTTENRKDKLVFRTILIGTILILLLAIWGIFNRIKFAKKVSHQNKVITTALNEKEVLLREIHHRVKNNLQVVSSLLSILSREIVDKKALEAVNESRNRVKSMALIHQNLYSEDNLTGIRIQDYIEKLGASLLRSYNNTGCNIKLCTEVENLNLDVDTTIPVGLILNELIANALKYAFPHAINGEIKITLKEQSQKLLLEVSDNGVGIDNVEEVEEEGSSFGNKLILAFATKLDAEYSIFSRQGTVVQLLIGKYKLA